MPSFLRQNRTRFILAFIALQALIPLGYYLGGRGDDERFSWRMFSTTRMLRCSVEVREQRDDQLRPVHIRKDVHMAWYEVLRRNRPAAVERYLARRCEHSGADRTIYRRQCVRSDGAVVSPLAISRNCSDGLLTTQVGSRGAP